MVRRTTERGEVKEGSEKKEKYNRRKKWKQKFYKQGEEEGLKEGKEM